MLSSFPETKITMTEYGRGVEVFPVTNEKGIRLEDSFPNGIIPNTVRSNVLDVECAVSVVNDEKPTSATNETRQKQNIVSSVMRILTAAAKFEEKVLSSCICLPNFSIANRFKDRPMNIVPSVVAFALLAVGLVPPPQVLCVVFLTAYITGLGFIGASSKTISGVNRDNSIIPPRLLSIPPQGHIPYLLSNPSGALLLNSGKYQVWLRFGVYFGLVGPLMSIIWYRFRIRDIVVASLVAKSAFLLCCQITTETFSNRILLPLPIRILIPIIYNTFRIPPLYEWAMSTTSLGLINRILAVINLFYWGVNLFAFLIPIATMKYLRSYFFCVEASEVTMRVGDEVNVGLLS